MSPLHGFVDFTRVGRSERFVAPVDHEIRGKVVAGDVVLLTDYDVEPLPFRVVEMLNDGRAARFELLSKAEINALLARVSLDPAICHGKPVIRGLRFPVENLRELIAAGMTDAEILADHPELEAADLLAAALWEDIGK